MKRLHIESNSPNFIGVWNISNDNLCDNLIKFFEKNIHLQKQGRVGGGINLNIKKTYDIPVDPINLESENYKIFKEYISELFKCYNDYKLQWPFLSKFKTVDIPSFNLQRYLSGDHFSGIHTERSTTQNMHRIFAWMTYLNDVQDQANGCTNFTHYNLKIKPEKGKTLIWPAEWTHAHAGEILNEGKKYIITGWICFPFN
tara:strand:+ start:1224 stop:1823 length:600 start_codon:yes stop_codon:yes gene_type:complete